MTRVVTTEIPDEVHFFTLFKKDVCGDSVWRLVSDASSAIGLIRLGWKLVSGLCEEDCKTCQRVKFAIQYMETDKRT